MGDWLSKVLTSYKADTSDHKAKLRELRGLEKQAAKERLSELDEHNRSIDKTIAAYGKALVAVGSAVALYKTAQAAAKAYLEDQRLEAAAAGVSIERLTKATRGLIEHDQLLAFAAKAQHGAWKLNEEQMEKVLHGALALRKTMGVELQPTIEKLTDAIGSGQVRALKEFGIVVKDSQGAIGQLDAAYKGLHGDVALAGDEFSASTVKLADAFDDIKGELGALVVSLAPVIDALASFVGFIREAVDGLGDLINKLPGPRSEHPVKDFVAPGLSLANKDRWKRDWSYGLSLFRGTESIFSGAEQTFAVDAASKAADQAVMESDIRAAIKLGLHAVGGQVRERLIKYIESLPRHGKGGDELTIEAASNVYRQVTPQAPLTGVAGGLGGPGASLDTSSVDAAVAAQRQLEAVQKIAADAAQASKERRESLLTQIIGSPAEISAQAEALQLATDAFQGFTDVAGAAYDALVAGQGGVMDAIKRAAAGQVEALGKEMFIRGLKEEAWAIADLAMGNFAGAGTHAAAGAAFLAGSVAAGALAHEMGYGSSTTPSHAGGGAGRSAGSYLGGGGGTPGEQTHNVTVIMGGGYEEMTDRERRARLARVVHNGLKGKSRTVRDG